MRKLSNLLLLLFLVVSLHAQDEMITIVQRNHYPADQFGEVLKSAEEYAALAAKNGANTPMTAWVFDDHTIEYVWEVPSAAGLDQITDEYNAVRMRIGEERMSQLKDTYTDREFWMGGEIAALSYVPEDVDLSEMNFIQVTRARIKTDDMEEFQRVAAQEAELAKQQNRQTPFYLEMYPMGLGARTFEIVEFGRDRADFERREAESKKTHYDTKEYKAWAKERDRVAEVISTRTATRNDAMSIRKPKDQPEPSRLLLVNEFTVAEGKMDAVMNYFATYNELATTYHYPQSSHFATSHDQQTLMHFVNLDDYADLERLRAKNRQMNYVPEEELAQVRRDNKGMFSDEQEYMLRYHPSKSYHSDSYQRNTDQPNAFTMTVYEYPYGQGKAAMKLVDDIKAAYEAVNSEIVYNVFTPDLGGPGNRIYVVTFGLDRDDLRRRNMEGNGILPADVRTDLQNRQEALMQVVRRVNGTTHFDKQYTPRTADATQP